MQDAIAEAAYHMWKDRQESHRRALAAFTVVADPEIPSEVRFALQARPDLAIPASCVPNQRQAPLLPPMTDLDYMLAMCIMPLSLATFASGMVVVNGAPYWWGLVGVGVSAALVLLLFVTWCLLFRRWSTLPALRAAEEFHGRYLVGEADFNPRARKVMQLTWSASQTIRGAKESGIHELDESATRQLDWKVAQYFSSSSKVSDVAPSDFCCRRQVFRHIRRHKRIADAVSEALDERRQLGHISAPLMARIRSELSSEVAACQACSI